MSDEATLRRAVLDDPEADGPRLTYAAWCDTQPDAATSARGEFIRIQVELANTDALTLNSGGAHRLTTTSGELSRRFGTTWAGPITNLVKDYMFRRGFVEYAKVRAPDFMARGSALFDIEPVRHLDLVEVREVGEALFASPLLARLHSLGLDRGGLYNIHLQLLAACPHVTNLRWLSAEDNNFDMVAYNALADSPHLGALAYAEFSGNKIDPVEQLGMDGAEVVAVDMPKEGIALEQRLGRRLEWLHREHKPAVRYAY